LSIIFFWLHERNLSIILVFKKNIEWMCAKQNILLDFVLAYRPNFTSNHITFKNYPKLFFYNRFKFRLNHYSKTQITSINVIFCFFLEPFLVFNSSAVNLLQNCKTLILMKRKTKLEKWIIIVKTIWDLAFFIIRNGKQLFRIRGCSLSKIEKTRGCCSHFMIKQPL